MADQQAVVMRKGREGGRWINERPSPEEFAGWFHDNMKLDPALKSENYVGGVVLIPAVDTKAKYVTGFTKTGVPVIEEREELSFIPYAKVETRIDYWWDLLEAHEDKWVGVVERITPDRLPLNTGMDAAIEAIGAVEGWTPELVEKVVQLLVRHGGAMTQLEYHLPEGFSVVSVPVGQGHSHFLLCTTRVSIYRREDYEQKGDAAVALRRGQGTKQVALVAGRSSVYADPNSLMKAETGALGRALGFAGIFVIPGSGVATAEDMLEALTQDNAPPQTAAPENAGPAAPAEAPVKTGAEQQVDEEQQLAQRAMELFKALQEDHPARAEDFGRWAHQRRLTKLSDAKGATLRGVVVKLEKLTDEAKQTSQQAAPGTVPPVTESGHAAARPPASEEAGESGAAAEALAEQPTKEGTNVSGETPPESR